MTWETGIVTSMEINRLAAQLAAQIDPSTSDDEVLRRCIGMALSQDLSDDQLHVLVSTVDHYSGRRTETCLTVAEPQLNVG